MTSGSGAAFRFIIIGIASTGLYFGLLVALRPMIASTALLAAVCYGLSMIFNFLAQGLWTFRSSRLGGPQIRRYAIMQGGAMGINSLGMQTLVERFEVPLLTSQLMITSLVTACVYVLSKRWVYR